MRGWWAMPLLVGCGGPKCPEYTGIREAGQYWDWQHHAEFTEETGVTGTYRVTVASLERAEDGDGFDVLLHTDGSSEAPDLGSADYTVDVEMVCDDQGAWMVSSEWSGDVVSAFGTFPVTLTKSLTSYDLMVVWDAALASTWASSPIGTTEDPQNGEQPFEDHITRTLIASANVTVPAGEFDALEMETVSEVDGTTSIYTVDGVGTIRDDVGELVEYGLLDE